MPLAGFGGKSQLTSLLLPFFFFFGRFFLCLSALFMGTHNEHHGGEVVVVALRTPLSFFLENEAGFPNSEYGGREGPD